MRLTIKPIFILTLPLLASFFLFTHGCGDTLSGKGSGGCPDNTAPQGSKIIGPTSLAAPYINSTSCYPTVGFTVVDAAGNALSGICVEIYSDANIALHSGAPDCHNVVASPQSGIVTSTDRGGNVIVELLTGPTPTGGTHFVNVSSGATSASAVTAAAK